jgi:hypothetical protein
MRKTDRQGRPARRPGRRELDRRGRQLRERPLARRPRPLEGAERRLPRPGQGGLPRERPEDARRAAPGRRRRLAHPVPERLGRLRLRAARPLVGAFDRLRPEQHGRGRHGAGDREGHGHLPRKPAALVPAGRAGRRRDAGDLGSDEALHSLGRARPRAGTALEELLGHDERLGAGAGSDSAGAGTRHERPRQPLRRGAGRPHGADPPLRRAPTRRRDELRHGRHAPGRARPEPQPLLGQAPLHGGVPGAEAVGPDRRAREPRSPSGRDADDRSVGRVLVLAPPAGGRLRLPQPAGREADAVGRGDRVALGERRRARDAGRRGLRRAPEGADDGLGERLALRVGGRDGSPGRGDRPDRRERRHPVRRDARSDARPAGELRRLPQEPEGHSGDRRRPDRGRPRPPRVGRPDAASRARGPALRRQPRRTTWFHPSNLPPSRYRQPGRTFRVQAGWSF